MFASADNREVGERERLDDRRLVFSAGSDDFVYSTGFDRKALPLTRAARELLAWSRQ